MEESTAQLDRLRMLVDAGIALSSELSLDAVLQRLTETAAELTGARYAALGVIGASGQGLERFLTTGIDPETHAAIGELGRVLFTDYMFAFEVTSILIIAAMVGAVILARKQTE